MIGSFVEAVCGMMDDSGFARVLEEHASSLQPETRDAMIDLRKAIALVDGNLPPLVVIESEEMKQVRLLAAKPLTVIYRVGLEISV